MSDENPIALSVSAAEDSKEHLALLLAMAKDRQSRWPAEELAGLLANGLVVFARVDEAVVATIGLEWDREAEQDADQANVAFLWETQPYNQAVMRAFFSVVVEMCRQNAFTSIVAEVGDAEEGYLSMFAGLGFETVEYVPAARPTAEEAASFNIAPSSTIDGYTVLVRHIHRTDDGPTGERAAR